MKTTIETSEHEQQAIDFLRVTNTSMTFKFLKHAPHFEGERESRDIWAVTLRNDLGRFTIKFGQSTLNTGKTPTPYDILSCVQKYDVGEFENFCDEFGYDRYNDYGRTNGIAKRIYVAVVKEYENICELFTDGQIELLQEIA